jgi:hypothetical protein
MKKNVLLVLGAVAMLVWCGGNVYGGGKKEPSRSSARQSSVPEPPKPPALFEGDGAKGIRLAVLAPTGIRLTKDDDWLPVFVQGTLTGVFNRFSAITVLDRQNMDKILAEQDLSASGSFSDEDYISIGNMTNTQYILAGSLTKTNAGYVLDLGISDAESGVRKYSYPPKNCSAAEIQGGDAVKTAAEDLLGQMGVTITAQGKTELHQAAKQETVEAETAMSKGIQAQKSGTVVEALSYYYNAASFDPSLAEAASRLSSLSGEVSSGNIGENVRNDIQRRNEWIKVLQEAEVFFRANPPFEVVYSPELTQGNVDYERETVGLSFKLMVKPTDGWKVIRNLYDGLQATGKAKEWGLDGWPEIKAGAGISGNDRSLFFQFYVEAALLNDQGRTIAEIGINTNRGPPRPWFLQADKDVSWDKKVNFFVHSHDLGSLNRMEKTFIFTVKANDITVKMTVQIKRAYFDNESDERVLRSRERGRDGVPLKVTSTIEYASPPERFYY